MAVLRTVEIWPATGFPHTAWDDDPAVDAIAKTSRRVCERYGEGLAAHEIRSRSASVRFFAATDPERSDLLVDVHLDSPGDESCFVHLPPGMAELSAQGRAGLVLDVIHGGLLRLAEARGWDTGAFEDARRHTVDHGLSFTWSSAWKSSPGRKLRARACYRIEDDGHSRVTVEIAETSTGHVLGTTPEVLGFSTIEGMKRGAKTLRWDGPGAMRIVGCPDPWGGSLGESRFEIGDLRHPTPVRVPDPTSAEYTVTVRGQGSTAPEQEPEIQVIGGGPMNDVPYEYIDALYVLLEEVVDGWTQWWSKADRALLEVWYRFGDDVREGVLVRLNENSVTARISRPTASMLTGRDGVRQAHGDVSDLMARVATRLGLGPHPVLTAVDDLIGVVPRDPCRF